MGRIDRALDFIERLARVVDRPDAALRNTRELLAEFKLSSKPLDYVEEMFQQLAAAGVDASGFTFNPALGRGLQYYTGIVFEVFAADAESSFQVCGGGRYDDLVEILTGLPSTPAVGLTFGIERLLMAMGGERPAATVNRSDVLVATIRGENLDYATKVCNLLRSAGMSTELDLKGLGIAANLAAADRTGIPVVVVLGDREAAAREASLRVIATGEQKTVELDILAGEVRAAMGDGKV